MTMYGAANRSIAALCKMYEAACTPTGAPATLSNTSQGSWQRCQQPAVTMQGLSTDTRPEVRNTGVRTLFSVVISQGSRLSQAAWDEALWEILFPLLQLVHQHAATSSRTEVCHPSPGSGYQDVHFCCYAVIVQAAAVVCTTACLSETAL